MLHDLLEGGSSFLKLAYRFFANFQGSVSGMYVKKITEVDTDMLL